MPRFLPKQVLLAACTLMFVSMVSGCVVPFYAYPTASFVPPVSVSAPLSEVHAFRVDCTRETGTAWDYLTPAGTDYDAKYKRLTEVPISKDGRISPLFMGAIASGRYVSGIGVEYTGHTTHTVSLVLYRPGFELVTIHGWEMLPTVNWRPCKDMRAQVKVLDELFPATEVCLGEESPEQQHALTFGLSEYGRLASLARQQDAVNLELATAIEVKAQELRERVNTHIPASVFSLNRGPIVQVNATEEDAVAIDRWMRWP
jgi:hypothetical protein